VHPCLLAAAVQRSPGIRAHPRGLDILRTHASMASAVVALRGGNPAWWVFSSRTATAASGWLRRPRGESGTEAATATKAYWPRAGGSFRRGDRLSAAARWNRRDGSRGRDRSVAAAAWAGRRAAGE